MSRNPRIGLLTIGLLTLTMMMLRVARSEDVKPQQRAGVKVEYPFGLVAFASSDRLQARAMSLAEAMGMPDDSQKILLGWMGKEGSEALSILLNSPGFDKTRPFGAMSYPSWFETPVEDSNAESQKPSEFDLLELLTDTEVESKFQLLAGAFLINTTLVVCLPTKDRAAMLKTWSDLLGDGHELKKSESRPGWYQYDDNESLRLGFVGNYLYLVGITGGASKFDRSFPEFDKLARSSLGKSGFVYSLQRRGLPEVVRNGMAPGLKMAAAALLQQRDNEPETDFRIRTMFGALQTEWLDVALSHVEEFRITGHVDNATRTIFVEPELVGPKDGKLAKQCNALSPTKNPFAGVTDSIGVVSTSLSLPLPEKLWKPVSEALHGTALTVKQPEAAQMIRTLAKTVESGQLDICAINPTWSDGLIAIRVAGSSNFPDQFQQMIAKLSDKPLFEFAVDSVDGIAIHRSVSRMKDVSPLSLLAGFLMGEFPNLDSALSSGSERKSTSEREVVLEDGSIRKVSETRTELIPGARDSMWIAATTQAIWIGIGSNPSGGCPEWFKSQIATAQAKPVKPIANNRGKSLFQLTLRDLGISSPGDDLISDDDYLVLQASGTNESDNNEIDLANATRLARTREKEQENILRDFPNAIRCEIRPTETGLKLSLSFEEAYFHWVAAISKQAADDAGTPPNLNPKAIDKVDDPAVDLPN